MMATAEYNSRQRLRPWLIQQLNEGAITGLQWYDNQRTMFRIPWKHGGKQDYTREEGLVFEMWATYTGKFQRGVDEPNPAKWKTNLRCALNKAKDIQEVPDLSNKEDSNPYKIYKFLPPKQGPTRKCNFDPNMQTGGGGIPESVSQQQRSWNSQKSRSLSSSLKNMSAEPMSGMSQLSDNTEQQLRVEQIMEVDEGTSSSIGVAFAVGQGAAVQGWTTDDSQPFPSPGSVSQSYASPGSVSQPYPSPGDAPIPAFIDNECHSTSIGTDEFRPPAPEPNNEVLTAAAGNAANGAVQVQEVSQTYRGAPIQEVGQVPGEVVNGIHTMGITDTAFQTSGFEYEVRYLDRPVDVRNLLGKNHIYYGDAAVPDIFTESIFGPTAGDSHKVKLPPVPGELQTNPHFMDVMELLESCQRGFVVRCVDGSLFLRRNCKVSVFFWNGQETVKIPRNSQEIPLFDYKEFCIKCQNGLRPNPEVQVYVGQKGSPDKVNKLYIVVKLKSVLAAKVLTDIFDQGEMSIEKEFSQSIETDKILEAFRGPGGAGAFMLSTNGL